MYSPSLCSESSFATSFLDSEDYTETYESDSQSYDSDSTYVSTQDMFLLHQQQLVPPPPSGAPLAQSLLAPRQRRAGDYTQFNGIIQELFAIEKGNYVLISSDKTCRALNLFAKDAGCNFVRLKLLYFCRQSALTPSRSCGY